MSTLRIAPQRHIERCMGTVFSFDVRSPGIEPDAIVGTMRWLHWVDQTFSTYRADSEINRLGRGEMVLDDCVAEVVEVLEHCSRLSRETGGYFSALHDGTLDPSGYVKGWAIERASDLLVAAGSVNHCVNGGGDVQCVGQPEPGRDWSVGIADPHRPGGLITAVSGTALAVATSGDAERGEHIIDPHTGVSPAGLSSVTVIGTRISVVDAYATAAFAMGEAAEAWLAGLPDCSAVIVYTDGRRRRTQPERISW